MSNLIDVNKVCAMLDISTSKPEIVAIVNSLITASIEIAQSYCERKFLKQVYRERFIGNNNNYVITQNYPILNVIQAPCSVEFIDNREIVFSKELSKGVSYIVEYEAGFDELPKDLELTIVEIVGWRYKSLKHLDVTSINDKGATVSYVRTELPENVKLVLEKYRKKF